MKKMSVTSFDIKDIVHFEFISENHTINRSYNVEMLKQLPLAVRKKMPEIWSNDWILHHDNASTHKAFSVRQFLAQKSITEMEHPPCSPDSAPNDFWLFPKIMSALKGRSFQDIEDVKEKCN
jgi:hypothetical protein